jgi:hypothetical protein
MKTKRQICVHRYSFHTEKATNKRKLQTELKNNKKIKNMKLTAIGNDDGTANGIPDCKYEIRLSSRF